MKVLPQSNETDNVTSSPRPNSTNCTMISHQGLTAKFTWRFQDDGKFVCLYPGCGCSYTRYQRLKGHFKQRHLNKG